MKILIKEIQKEIYIAPKLLIIKQVEERLDVKPKRIKITWTDQHNVERDIIKLTDGHAANLSGWLRDRGLMISEKIIQAELERRCTGIYPEWFDEFIEKYKSSPEIWRLKVL